METTSLYLVILAIIQCVHSDSESPDDICNPDGFGGYSHPDWWCETLCANPKTDESPIDIDTSLVVSGDDTCTARLDWKIDWRQDLFKIENTCHSVQLTPLGFNKADILTPFNDDMRAIAVLKTKNTPFEGEYEDYCLAQLHFHWGSNVSVGSEHLVDGKAFPLEVHFVHFACEYGTVSAAIKKGIETTEDEDPESVDHVLAVVSILFEVSDNDNPALDVILSDEVVDGIRNCGDSVIIGNRILPDIVPRGAKNGGYYAYQGSLTTPPCTDDVDWIVLKTRGSVSERQLEQFRTLLDEDGEEIKRNWRYIQDNSNEVMDCDEDPWVEKVYRHRHHRGGRRHHHHHHHRPYMARFDDFSGHAISKDMKDVVE
eukprot:1168183_1